MEDLDTEKVKDILEMMKSYGAVFLKYKELIIEFPRDTEGEVTAVVGFEAGNKETEEVEASAKGTRPVQPRPTGYTALLGDKRPSFLKPRAEGRE